MTSKQITHYPSDTDFGWQDEYSGQYHELWKGDCLKVMKEKIGDASIDLILADLPYGTTRNSWDSIIPVDKLWAEYHRVLKPNGVVVLTAAEPFDKVMAMSNLREFKYEWIWHKNKATGHLSAKLRPLHAHEHVLVFYKKQPIFNPQNTEGHKPMNKVNARKLDPKRDFHNYGKHDTSGNLGGATTRCPRSVLHIAVHNNDDKDKVHPTQKPVKLMEYFIRTYTHKGATVLDNVMGSGTTGVAALKSGRNFIGIELNAQYFNIAKKRLARCIEGGNRNISLD